MNERDENPDLEQRGPAFDPPGHPPAEPHGDPAPAEISHSLLDAEHDQAADASDQHSETHASLQSAEDSQVVVELPVARLDGHATEVVLPGDPMAGAASYSKPVKFLPEDLRVSWSWPHLILFLFFGFASLMAVQLGFVFFVSSNAHLSATQVQKVFEDSPQLLVGSNVLWYALLFLFLYVTLALLRDVPFWNALGWRKLPLDPATGKSNWWKYFFSGSGLALFVALASFNMKNTEHLPIQELFKNRTGALMLMGMAVLVAPLVEETVFRGYLYPLFAKSLGMLPGILITGVLFGLMHGSQLGWTWGLVLLLTFVGIVFTFARARTGTVAASFLLHLGYNSMIAVSSIIATKGFQHMPTQP
jgi:membrane protease YdiL (CAAX protease family)